MDMIDYIVLKKQLPANKITWPQFHIHTKK